MSNLNTGNIRFLNHWQSAGQITNNPLIAWTTYTGLHIAIMNLTILKGRFYCFCPSFQDQYFTKTKIDQKKKDIHT